MKLLISYGLAGLIFFTAGTAVDSGTGLQEQMSDHRPAAQMKPVTPPPYMVVSPLSADKAISEALALHGNRQKIPPSVFIDLIRTMERNGFERNVAIHVIVVLAKNPNLDQMAGLTVAGSLRGYRETTNEQLDEAVTELVSYIEQPTWGSNRVNERFGLLSPDVERLIGDKISSGNQIAAERLMEEALLRRFNPSLAAKIFVSRNEFPSIQIAALSGEHSGREQRRQAQQVVVLSKTSKLSSSRVIVTARRPAFGNGSSRCCLRHVATRR